MIDAETGAAIARVASVHASEPAALKAFVETESGGIAGVSKRKPPVRERFSISGASVPIRVRTLRPTTHLPVPAAAPCSTKPAIRWDRACI